MGTQRVMKTYAFVALSTVTAVLAAPSNGDPTPPHLSQAWIAQSSGDGLPNTIGKESYIYDDCPHGTSADCMKGHIFDYGSDNCIKYEIDGGFHYPGTGRYYVKCDSVDCCKEATPDHNPAPKKWDIAPTSWWSSTKTTYLGKHDTEELNNKTVTGADVWSQVTTLPFAKKLAVNYTFYITKQGNDTISHRIDFIVPGQTAGSILYGDFQPQHDLAAFRKTFMPPAPCLKKNVLPCADGFAQKGAPGPSPSSTGRTRYHERLLFSVCCTRGVHCCTRRSGALHYLLCT